MEIVVRCSVPDRPGALAALAGAIGEVGGDIHAVDVVEHDGRRALDDVVVVVPRGGMRSLIERIEALDGVEVVHAGPSRGHPGDAATRLAVAVEAMLNGALPPDRGVATLVGGALRCTEATLLPAAEAPEEDDGTLVVPVNDEILVLRRDYRFTRAERERALALTRLCEEIGRQVAVSSPWSG